MIVIVIENLRPTTARASIATGIAMGAITQFGGVARGADAKPRERTGADALKQVVPG